MAERYIQDFTTATTPEEGDLFHIQRDISGVWTDMALAASNLLGNNATPLVIYQNLNLTDLYADTYVEIAPDISGSGLGYMPIQAMLRYTYGTSGGPSGTVLQFYRDSIGASGTWGTFVLDLDQTDTQVSPANWPSGHVSLPNIPGLWLYTPGLATGDGRLEVWVYYFTMTNTP